MLKQAKVHLVALGALAFGSLAGVGCAVEDGTGDEEVAAFDESAGNELALDESPALDESGSERASIADAKEAWDPGATDGVQALEGRYCVDQSYASIQYVNIDSCGGFPCVCPPSLNPDAQFSRGHPVNVHLYGCGAYYFVKDLWSSNYGWMRQDALTPC